MTAGVQHNGAPPVTSAQWNLYLAEYHDQYPGEAPQHTWPHPAREPGRTHRLGCAPASEQRLAATEQRLGARLPPSLRGFLMVSNGWDPVPGIGWMPAISACEEIDWFRSTHREFIDAYLEGGDRGPDDFFLNTLSLARGEDTVLLDTRRVCADGEYEAYVFAVAFGHLDEPCASFSALVARNRAQSERIRSLLAGH